MKTNIKQGLSSAEVKKRQIKYGLNKISEKNTSEIIQLLKKFIAPIPLMIEAAMLLSAISSKWEEFTIITILLSINIGIDFIQGKKAHSALKALKETLAHTALVLRDGKFVKIDAAQLVPGDIIKLKIGDVIPADAVLRKGIPLQIDQSALTGESLPVEKQKDDTVYADSIIKKGGMLAEITVTGNNTFIGKSARLVEEAEKTKISHFQKAVIRIGNFLIVLSLCLIFIIVIISLVRGNSLLETIRFALVLAVASIPVALPAVLSVTMAVGALAIVRKNAIVSNFKAIEELAGIDILCTDKTGTLTKNEMSVSLPITYKNFDEAALFTYALLASERENQDPIEIPLYAYAKKNNFIQHISEYSIKSFTPFNPTDKIAKAVVLKNNITYTIIKGAPQVVALLSGEKTVSNVLAQDVENFAKKGFRTLAVAIKQGKEKTFTTVGLIPLFDPPRDDSKETVATIKEAGIKIKMLTGDNSAIAKQIAKILGIGSKILSAASLKPQKKGNIKDNIDTIIQADGFAEVLPEDKYAIVSSLQKHDKLVAMTGDGVNDAPALKKADIGIAVSGATDAARSASDVVLLSPGLSVIRDAITYARMTFSRMQSYATFRIAETMRIVLFISLSIIFFNSYPISAIMIIILALLNDIPVMAIAYDNAKASKASVRWHLKETIFIASVLGVAGLISSFGLFYWLRTHQFSFAIIQTIIFLKLDVAGHSTLYITRTGRGHFWQRPFPSLKFFIPAFGSRIIGTIIAMYGIFMQPIGWRVVVYIWIYAILWFIFNDYVKIGAYKLLDLYKNRKSLHLKTE